MWNDMENMAENSEKTWKIRKNSEKIGKIQGNCEKIWKFWKKVKLNSQMI